LEVIRRSENRVNVMGERIGGNKVIRKIVDMRGETLEDQKLELE
jgi:hypothetical protein